MKIQLLCILSAVFFVSSCKGPEGPQGPTGPSGSDALTDPTVTPKVIWTFPSNGQVGPISNFSNEIYIRFNKILDISTLNRSFQISPSGSGYARIDTNNIYVPTGDLVNVYIDADSSYVWAIGQTYTVTVLTALKDINGNSLSGPHSFSFTPEPYFRVTYTYPRNGATNVYRYPYIELYFNNRINFSTFLSSISISPPVSGSWYNSGNYVYLYPSTQLNPNTEYVVTLGTGMRDTQGRALSSPYTFSFTTGE